ncbi:MAG: acetoacetate decarboxylase family protein [Marmoricola sp.]
MRQRPELTGLPGIAETILTEALVDRLPDNRAEAPWSVQCRAMMWLGRGGAAARSALSPALSRSSALAVVGGFVRYSATPVGPYDEVLGLVASRDGRNPFGTVAFMSVDSEESLVGGRTNWAMPKTLASFTGEIDREMTASASDGPQWTVGAHAHSLGPELPLHSTGQARQEFADGSVRASRLEFRGTARPALVTVAVSSHGDLARWLRPGRHPGVVISHAEFTLGAAS